MRQYRMITPTFCWLFDLPWPRFTREWGGNQSLLNRYIVGDRCSCSWVTAVLVRGLPLFLFKGYRCSRSSVLLFLFVGTMVLVRVVICVLFQCISDYGLWFRELTFYVPYGIPSGG